MTLRFRPKNRLMVHALGWACFQLLALFGMAIATSSIADAEDVEFTATVDQTEVQVGSTIQFNLNVKSNSGQVNANPTLPDFGGLKVAGGPANSTQTTIINGAISTVSSIGYLLRAPQAGKFTIGASRLSYNGKSYETRPITVTVTMQPPPSLPGDLKDEHILSARSNNSEVNKMIDGRLFLRTIVSNKNPYVRQPIVISYVLYWDRVQFQNLQSPGAALHAGNGIVEDRFLAKNLQPRAEVHGGRTYQAALLYQVSFTPTQAGTVDIDGYTARCELPVRRQGANRDPNDPFSAFDDSFFGNPFNRNVIQVEMAAPPIKLEVRPLPEGQPAGFSGTVGNYTLKASADRASIKQDELLTLDLYLQGNGAIDFAGAPQFPDNPSFELVDKTNETDKQKQQKRFQYSLRPRKFGRLEVPAIEYPVFNPDEEAYNILSTVPIPIQVAAVAGMATPVPVDGEKIVRKETASPELNFIEPIDSIRLARIEPLLESPLLWLAQFGGLALFLVMWRRDWRKARLDPAAVRRNGAWRAFEKRLRAIRSQAAAGQQSEAARGFDAAVRNLIADYYNTSAEGMTFDEISQLLAGSNLSREQVANLLDRLDACSWASYAPSSEPIDILSWSAETRAMLREGLKA